MHVLLLYSVLIVSNCVLYTHVLTDVKELEPSSEDLGVQAVKPLSEVLDDEDGSSLIRWANSLTLLVCDYACC